MNAEQKKWFEDFATTKASEIHSIKKGGDSKIWKYISHHYSDKAHFLYELIQNADDAGAKHAQFELYAAKDDKPGYLVFRHDGTKHFEITKAAPRDDAGFDSALRDKTLDSVYSICTVGNSTKETNDIGKFGIGFKSVFIYTDTPRIYDDGIRFEISNFVVPRSLEDEADFEGRGNGETVFVFPFNRTKGDHLPSDPYNDVMVKLRSLILPTLFLKNLDDVNWKYGDLHGQYVVAKNELFVPLDGSNSKVYLARAEKRGIYDSVDEFVLIERPIERGSELRLTIGFGVSDGKLTPIEYAPFCYFATQVSFGLKFLVNAPFVLTSTRQSLDFSSDESISNNKKMMDGLSSLLADSLVYLRDLGRSNPMHVYLTEDIFNILSLDENFVPKQEMDKLNIQRNDPNNYFAGFYSKPLEKFQEEEIIPCSLTKGEYCRRNNACYAEVKNIVENFDDSDLSGVATKFDGLGAAPRWVYAQTYDYAFSERARATNRYVESIGARRIKAEEWVHALAGSYVEGKSNDTNWLQKFYNWISKRPEDEKVKAKSLPIILNQDSHACPAELNGAMNLYLPEVILDGEMPMDVNFVRADIHALEGVQALERSWHIGKFDTEALSSRLIQQLKESCDSQRREKVTCQLLTLLADRARVSVEIADRVATSLRDFGVFKAQDGNLYPSKSLYKYSEEWSEFTGLVCGAKRYFVDWNYYAHIASEEVLESIGITSIPVVEKAGPEFIKDIYGNWLKTSDINWQQHKPEYRNSATSKIVAYLERVGVTWSFKSLQFSFVRVPVLESLLDLTSGDVSKEIKGRCEGEIWRILLAIAKSGDANVFRGEYIGVSANSQIGGNGRAVNPDREEHKQFSSLILKRLQETMWIVCGDELIKPNGIDSAKLPPKVVNALNFEIVARWLNITTAAGVEVEKMVRRANLSDEERKLLEWAEHFSIEERERWASVSSGGKQEQIKKDIETEVRKRVSKLVSAEQDDPYLDLGEEFEEDLKSALKYDKIPPEVGAENVMKVLDFLAIPNLRIPDYQRPYKWTRRSVLELLSDIDKMVIEKCKEDNVEPSMRPYRVGTIVLNKKKDEIGDQEYYDIVDGQQRTITFTLLALGVGLNLGHISNSKFYPALSQCLESQRNLHNNMIYICEYLKSRTEGNADYLETLNKVLAESLEVVVICVETQEEAFQLFDSQNTRGRPLAPHDLLKAYHLRLMKAPKEASEEERKEFEKEEAERVRDWENLDSNVIGGLFQDVLYPIYRWSRKEKSNVFSTKDIYVFKGVPLGYKDKYGYVDRVCVTGAHFQIGDDFTPGKCFFEYVKHYLAWKRKIEELLARDEYASVRTVVASYNSPYARNLFYAVLMAYFDRFGFDIPTEDVRRTVVKLCLWAYSVCLDLAYFGAKTPNKYAIGLPDGNDRYSNQKAMFYLIRNAVFHTDVAKIVVEHSKREGDQFTGERVALQKALKELK